MQIKKILVPYDFSEYADGALDWAQECAEKWSASVSLLYIVPAFSQLAHPESVQLLGLASLAADMVVDAERRLQQVVAKRGLDSISTKTRALLGDPLQGICEFAEQNQSDLIVMGSHGRTGLAHVFLGSVAERVVRHAPCPVLVVRPLRTADADETGGTE